MNDKGVYRTAPATMGLLKNSHILHIQTLKYATTSWILFIVAVHIFLYLLQGLWMKLEALVHRGSSFGPIESRVLPRQV